jgi:hypothetical protein
LIRTRKLVVQLGLGAPATGSPANVAFGLIRMFVTFGSTPFLLLENATSSVVLASDV